jgi:hypothetical protein
VTACRCLSEPVVRQRADGARSRVPLSRPGVGFQPYARLGGSYKPKPDMKGNRHIKTTIIGTALVALTLAACGASAPATLAPSTAVSATSQPAAVNPCPKTYTGQRVDLSGTVESSLAIGGNYIAIVKDGNGQTCQLVTHTNPGQAGATVAVQNYVAYVSPGTPPISRIAPGDYAATDH